MLQFPAYRSMEEEYSEYMENQHVIASDKIAYMVFAKFVSYLEEQLAPLSAAEKKRLSKGVELAFFEDDVQELIAQSLKAGAALEAIAEVIYRGRSVPKAAKAVWGFKSKFKMAQMLSAAAYAASPESEAYWAS